MSTIRACLAALGVASADVFAGCAGVAEEFAVVKRLYIRLALTSHPDKGGDAEHFRKVQEAWESVRTTFERRVPRTSFLLQSLLFARCCLELGVMLTRCLQRQGGPRRLRALPRGDGRLCQGCCAHWPRPGPVLRVVRYGR